MTKFSFEVPIPHLRDFEDLQDFHFLLIHLFENEEYFDYMGLPGEVVIDNSANELGKPTPVNEMIGRYNLFNPCKIICPDHDPWSSSQLACAYLSFPAHIRGDVWVVVQSEEQLDYMTVLGAREFCIPYEFRRFYYKLNLSDYKFKIGSDFGRFHFLGLNSVPEIQVEKPKSCDTSMPIKLALKGMNLEDWATEGYPHYDTIKYADFFSIRMTNEEVDLARKNILDLKEVCK